MRKNLKKIFALSALLVFAAVGVLLLTQGTTKGKAEQVLLKENNVSTSDSRRVTIYYSGFDNPYIHYCVDNGTWTNVPGIAMNQSSDAEGYTHKFTVNIQNESTITACFNNGLGTWDNNNGNNYTFNVGTYGVKNGVVSEVADNAIKVTGLYNYTPAYHSTGAPVDLRAYVINSTGNVTYTFEATKNGISKIIQTSYSNICLWIPETAGIYTIRVTALDESFNYDIRTMEIEIIGSEFAVSDLSNSASNKMIVNTTSVLSFDVTAGVKPVYTSIKINGVVQALNLNSLEWCPQEAGEYEITATAKDYYNTVVSKTIYVTVYDNVEIVSIVSTLGETLSTGDTSSFVVISNVQLDGATYSIALNGNKILDNNTSNAKEYTFTEAGSYLVEATINYAGNTYYKSTTVNVTEDNKLTIHYNGFATPYCHYKVGNTWTNVPGVGMTATSNVIGYTHEITINLSEYEEATVCFTDGNGNWDSNNGLNYTFSKGVYGYHDGQIINLNQEAFKMVSFFCYDLNYAFVGGLLDFRACAINGSGNVKYAFYKTVNGQEVCFQDYSSSEKGLLNVTEYGLHKITVRAYDEKGNTCEASLEVNIESESSIKIYYSGLEADTVYIHYAINGVWTTLPGVAMSFNGTYYTITISINQGDSFVCCFTDGNGTWDNNNGSDYVLEAGTSYIR